MAQPKRRWSKARTHKRRSMWKNHIEFVKIVDIMMEKK